MALETRNLIIDEYQNQGGSIPKHANAPQEETMPSRCRCTAAVEHWKQSTSEFSGLKDSPQSAANFCITVSLRQRADIDVHHNHFRLCNPIKLLMTISSHPSPPRSALSEPPSYTQGHYLHPTADHHTQAQPNVPSDTFHTKRRDACIKKISDPK